MGGMANAAEVTKLSNPKDLIGSNKIPFHLWPETATAVGAMACLYGALQYGRTNWRDAGVRSSIYVDACRRHLNAWFDEGEDADPDSGLDHLGHALACIAIIVDAREAGKLNDDRMIKGGYRGLIEKLTPHVKRLKEMFKDKNPKHFTKEDSDGKAAVDCNDGFTKIGEEHISPSFVETVRSAYSTEGRNTSSTTRASLHSGIGGINKDVRYLHD